MTRRHPKRARDQYDVTHGAVGPSVVAGSANTRAPAATIVAGADEN